MIASIIGATGLKLVRHGNGRRSVPAQWLGDALNIGTLILLGWIAAGQFLTKLRAEQIEQENKVLITLGLAYCAFMIGAQLIDSVKKDQD